MEGLIFIYEHDISCRKKQFSVRIALMNYLHNRWVLKGAKRVYYAEDLKKIQHQSLNINLLHMAVQSEMDYRKKEGRFASLRDEFTRLRINPDILPSFLNDCISSKIICDIKGKVLSFASSKPEKTVVRIKRVDDSYLIRLFFGEVSFNEIDYLVPSEPLMIFTSSLIFTLVPYLTKTLIHSIPHGKKLLSKELEALLARLDKFKDIINLSLPARDFKQVLDKPVCYPSINISRDLSYGSLSFEYPEGIKINAFDKRDVIYQNGCELIRNIEEEQFYCDILEKNGAVYRKTVKGEWYLASLKVKKIISVLEKEGFEILIEGKVLNISSKMNFDISVYKNNIYLKGNLAVNSETIGLDSLFNAIDNNQAFSSLNDGSVVLLPFEDIKKLKKIRSQGVFEDDRIIFKDNNFSLLANFSRQHKDIKIDKNFETLLKFEENFNLSDEILFPDCLDNILRPYQKQGVRWLRSLQNLGFSGILADDMGLGKTLQVLSLLMILLQKKSSAKILLIVPSTLIFNWEIEINKFAEDKIKYLLHSGTRRGNKSDCFMDFNLIITSYAIVLRDFEILKEQQWDFLILDEAQIVKNPLAKTTSMIKQLSSKHRISISGTPVENSPIDLWSHFDFLMPGFLGSLKEFKIRYRFSDLESLKELNLKTKPFVLRRLKSQVLNELPLKTETTFYCEFSKEQRELYTQYLLKGKKEVSGLLEEKKMKNFSILEAILRLRQISCHSDLVSQSDKFINSGKSEVVVDTALEILSEGHKILIFSQFVKHLKLIRKLLNQHNIKSFYLDGSSKDRKSIVEGFNKEPNASIFFISIKAGGLGLNLTSASYVFLLDPWWNPLVENQAIDRCYRIGQEKHVNVYRFITKDSIEEKVELLQKQKLIMEENIISETSLETSPFSTETLKELIKEL